MAIFNQNQGQIYGRTPIILLFLLAGLSLRAQSVEVMPGTEYFFADVQFFRPLDQQFRSSFFHRTRVQLDYDNQASFFTAAYLNYTTASGLGPSLVSRLDNGGGNLDVGLHYYRQNGATSFFGLLAASLTDGGVISWFSILRHTPTIAENWKLYSSLELFTVLRKADHTASIQRLRLGLSHRSYQFGLAANLLELGNDFVFLNDSYGLFIRTEF